MYQDDEDEIRVTMIPNTAKETQLVSEKEGKAARTASQSLDLNPIENKN